MKILIKTNKDRNIQETLSIFQDKSYEFFKENAFSIMKYDIVNLILEKPNDKSDVFNYFKKQYPNINFDINHNLTSHLKQVIFTEISAPKILIQKNGVLIDSHIENIKDFFYDLKPFDDYEIINDRNEYNWFTHNSYIGQLKNYGKILTEFSKRMDNSEDTIKMAEDIYNLKINDFYSFILNENEQFYKKETV